MIRIGIVGTGGVANGHATQLAALKGVGIVACCDIFEERAWDYAQRAHAVFERLGSAMQQVTAQLLSDLS